MLEKGKSDLTLGEGCTQSHCSQKVLILEESAIGKPIVSKQPRPCNHSIRAPWSLARGLARPMGVRPTHPTLCRKKRRWSFVEIQHRPIASPRLETLPIQSMLVGHHLHQFIHMTLQRHVGLIPMISHMTGTSKIPSRELGDIWHSDKL